ncbi:MAG: hypothetical protein IJ352_08285 [Muribaculaceae bacterium]|nr:hypothetical protein [Muribaculaceae bacterium]
MDIIVLEYKVTDLYTFLDKMQMYELNWLLPNLYYVTKQQLESTRFIAYMIAQSQSAKQLKVTDIMTFEWDKKTMEEKANNIPTKEEIEKLKAKVKARETEINIEKRKHT